MGIAYSDDLRKRVIGAIKAGRSARKAAELFDVSVTFAIVLARRWRRTGSYKALPRGRGPRSILDEHEVYLLGLVDKVPDITLKELIAKLATERGVTVALGTMWRFFDKRGFSFKKNRARRRAGPSRRSSGARKMASKAAAA